MNQVDLREFAPELAEREVSPMEEPPKLVDRVLIEDSDVWLATQPLFNPSSPGYLLKRERPEHRAIVYLKCQGLSYREVAEKVGWTAAGVSNVCRQPWAQKLILGEITKAGRDAVEVFLSAEDLNSLAKLRELRDDPEAPKEVQRKCANDLLDRKYGRPTQPIVKMEVDPKAVSDAELMSVIASSKSN